MITLWTSTGEPILHEVSGLDIWLPCNGDLVLCVQFIDILLVFEYKLCVLGSVKGPWCGPDLGLLVLLPFVRLWLSKNRASIHYAVAAVNHVLSGTPVDTNICAQLTSSIATVAERFV